MSDGEEASCDDDLSFRLVTSLERFSHIKLRMVEIMQMASSPVKTIKASYS
jgi:hypothetical protein